MAGPGRPARAEGAGAGAEEAGREAEGGGGDGAEAAVAVGAGAGEGEAAAAEAAVAGTASAGRCTELGAAAGEVVGKTLQPRQVVASSKVLCVSLQGALFTQSHSRHKRTLSWCREAPKLFSLRETWRTVRCLCSLGAASLLTVRELFAR